MISDQTNLFLVIFKPGDYPIEKWCTKGDRAKSYETKNAPAHSGRRCCGRRFSERVVFDGCWMVSPQGVSGKMACGQVFR